MSGCVVIDKRECVEEGQPRCYRSVQSFQVKCEDDTPLRGSQSSF